MSDIRERLQKYKVNSETGCWEWTGTRSSRGYGRIKIDGKPKTASRVAYEEYVAPIPPGLLVCHKCDNPPCINPDHLFVGTNAENMADCARKGRARGPLNKGRNNGRAVINEHQARAIFNSTATRKTLAEQYGISITAVHLIRHKRTWRFIHD